MTTAISVFSGCQNSQVAKLQNELDSLRRELEKQKGAVMAESEKASRQFTNEAELVKSKFTKDTDSIRSKITEELNFLKASTSPELKDELAKSINSFESAKETISNAVKSSQAGALEIESLRKGAAGNGQYQIFTSVFPIFESTKNPLTRSAGSAIYITAVVDKSTGKVFCRSRQEREEGEWFTINPPSNLVKEAGRYMACIEYVGRNDNVFDVCILDSKTGKLYLTKWDRAKNNNSWKVAGDPLWAK